MPNVWFIFMQLIFMMLWMYCDYEMIMNAMIYTMLCMISLYVMQMKCICNVMYANALWI